MIASSQQLEATGAVHLVSPTIQDTCLQVMRGQPKHVVLDERNPVALLQGLKGHRVNSHWMRKRHFPNYTKDNLLTIE